MRAAGPAPYARRAAPAAALRQSRRRPDVRRARRCKARALSLQGEIAAAAAAAERKPRADIVLSSGFLAFAYHCGFVEVSCLARASEWVDCAQQPPLGAGAHVTAER